MKKLFFFLLVNSCLVMAQEQRTTIALIGGVALPAGDFGETSVYVEEAGMATTGFGVGLEFDVAMNSPGMSWITTVSYLRNTFDEDALQTLFEGFDNVSIEASAWSNIPFLTGIKYEAGSAQYPKISLIGMAGLDIVIPPDYEINTSYQGVPVTASQDLDIATAFGLCVGGGISFNQKITISVQYMYFGKPSLEGNAQVSYEGYGTQSSRVKIKNSISLLFINMGIFL